MLVQVVRICLNIKTLYCIWQLVTGGLTGVTTLLLSQGILAEIHVILVSFKRFFIGYFGLLLLYYRQQANFTTTFVVLAWWYSGNLACSRLLARCAKESARGRKRGGNEGEKKRGRRGACNHFLKHLMPVYQLPVYPLIGQF